MRKELSDGGNCRSELAKDQKQAKRDNENVLAERVGDKNPALPGIIGACARCGD